MSSALALSISQPVKFWLVLDSRCWSHLIRRRAPAAGAAAAYIQYELAMGEELYRLPVKVDRNCWVRRYCNLSL